MAEPQEMNREQLQEAYDRLQAERDELAARLARSPAKEAMLEDAQRIGRLGSFDWDLTTNAVAWSDVIFELFEADPTFDTSFQNIFSRVYPEDQARIMGLIQHAIATGETIEDDYRIHRVDGSEGVLFTRARLVKDGDHARLIGTAQDVTASRHAEAELAKLNRALAARSERVETERARMWELSDDLMAVANLDGYFLRVNPAFERALGWTSEELTSQPLTSFVHPEDRPSTRERLEGGVGDEATRRFENRYRTRSGGYRWLSWRSTLANGLLYTVARDVTEQREAYDELQVMNEELASQQAELQAALSELGLQQSLTERLIEDAPAAIAFLDTDLVFRRANAAYARMIRIPAEQLLGRSVFDVFGPGSEAQLGPIMRGVLASGEPYSGENFPFDYELDGQPHRSYWDFTHAPVMGQDGKPMGLLNLSIEVSDRVRAAQLREDQLAQLRESDRYKDEFLSVISHELRTPLNFIMGFASTLDDEVQGPLNPAQHQAVGKILTGADRMLGLVDDLLDVARIQSGALRLLREPTPVGPLVDEVVAALAPSAAAKGLMLAAEVSCHGAPMLDGSRVVQALTNLVGNAIKFTREGQIAVHAFERGHELVLEVSDTGCGIGPADLTKLFQRFRQVDMSVTRGAGGTGLGLSIVKALAEAHGGRVEVESEPGRGSTFRVILPLA